MEPSNFNINIFNQDLAQFISTKLERQIWEGHEYQVHILPQKGQQNECSIKLEQLVDNLYVQLKEKLLSSPSLEKNEKDNLAKAVKVIKNLAEQRYRSISSDRDAYWSDCELDDSTAIKYVKNIWQESDRELNSKIREMKIYSETPKNSKQLLADIKKAQRCEDSLEAELAAEKIIQRVRIQRAEIFSNSRTNPGNHIFLCDSLANTIAKLSSFKEKSERLTALLSQLENIQQAMRKIIVKGSFMPLVDIEWVVLSKLLISGKGLEEIRSSIYGGDNERFLKVFLVMPIHDLQPQLLNTFIENLSHNEIADQKFLFDILHHCAAFPELRESVALSASRIIEDPQMLLKIYLRLETDIIDMIKRFSLRYVASGDPKDVGFEIAKALIQKSPANIDFLKFFKISDQALLRQLAMEHIRQHVKEEHPSATERLADTELMEGKEQALEDLRKKFFSLQPMEREGFRECIASLNAFERLKLAREVVQYSPLTILKNIYYFGLRETDKEEIKHLAEQLSPAAEEYVRSTKEYLRQFDLDLKPPIPFLPPSPFSSDTSDENDEEESNEIDWD